mmetsp:Transcript_122621/g.261685  ORF Transcript_122621/g.261685 Transcript_122621/m.261685 type:complete len:295 (+) Transcript_122621:135-1019(+)
MGQTCTGNSLNKTSEEINCQVEAIEAKIRKADESIRHFVALGAADPAAKQRALQAMKRKKVLEGQRQQLIGAQFNVDSLADQQEQADTTLRAVDAIRAGRDKLKKDQERMSVQQVDALLDETEDLADEMRAINESLAQGSGLADGALELEYGQLLREYAPESAGALASRQAQAQALSLDPEAAARQAAGPQRKRAAAKAAAERQQYGAPEGLPAPPPPPPPRASATAADRHRSAATTTTANDEYANFVAAHALSAAMAPYGHLPLPAAQGPPPQPMANPWAQQPPQRQRIPVAA